MLSSRFIDEDFFKPTVASSRYREGESALTAGRVRRVSRVLLSTVADPPPCLTARLPPNGSTAHAPRLSLSHAFRLLLTSFNRPRPPPFLRLPLLPASSHIRTAPLLPSQPTTSRGEGRSHPLIIIRSNTSPPLCQPARSGSTLQHLLERAVQRLRHERRRSERRTCIREPLSSKRGVIYWCSPTGDSTPL